VPEYADMQREVAELAGRFNGQFGDLDWTPIRYINRSIKRQALAGIYRIAKVGLVTPLRDGMNLVAKEYVASQDAENPGALILSRFAGAARELDGALLVNPYDIEDIAQAIATALEMPLGERKERWASMNARVVENDVTFWCESFLAALHKTRVMAAEIEELPKKRTEQSAHAKGPARLAKGSRTLELDAMGSGGS
jgi:trehalose 6-phosphate synthase